MSQTSRPALRAIYAVVQIGSKLARSACGTSRTVRAAARCEMAGVVSPLAAAKALTRAADLRKVRRSIGCHYETYVSADLSCRARLEIFSDHRAAQQYIDLAQISQRVCRTFATSPVGVSQNRSPVRVKTSN